MNSRKSDRVGERVVNRQGLTMEIVKYRNNKNVEIVFLETGERRTVRYLNFRSRNVRANLVEHPYLIVTKAKKCARTTKKVLYVLAALIAAGALIMILR